MTSYFLISHRGNINGKNIERENCPDYIDEAIDAGYQVEIDVRSSEDGGIFLGHDSGQYEIDLGWLTARRNDIWIHAKDLRTLNQFSNDSPEWRVFWHQNDDFTLTSNNFIWTYPGKELCENSICVLPESTKWSYDELVKSAGFCSDFIQNYRREKIETT